MKKFVIQAVLLIAVLFLALFFYKNPQALSSIIPTKFQGVTVKINEVSIQAEVADSPEKRRQGLGGRKSLDQGSGMLFIMDEKKRHTFWMKNLKFSIDLIWIDEDKVVDIISDVPPPKEGEIDANLPTFSPSLPADKVLEVNGGFAKKYNIKIDDRVEIFK
ncbi:DUF192 domain-containing protein [Candidatus Daviesbacteria bacterium]|nr:DUF192 domain-containing protein [Candidatus Daviesbacteria bacterium]